MTGDLIVFCLMILSFAVAIANDSVAAAICFFALVYGIVKDNSDRDEP